MGNFYRLNSFIKGHPATRRWLLSLHPAFGVHGSDLFQGTPASVGGKQSADSVVPALRMMGTLEELVEGTRNPDLIFDGSAKQ